ncbi:MAG: hypothetical protein NWE96_00210 [Candidatus Bathyarchaeota archaeon]|nr:hypothetical protein [Candidatus Bathyarchaeota archaeon]
MKKSTIASEFKNTADSALNNEDISGMIKKGGKRFLLTLKQKSIRSNNSWFRLLSVDKRRLIDAVIQTVDQVKSALLIKILSPLAEKLLQAIGGLAGLMGKLNFTMTTFAQFLAKRISQIAQKWGNKLAASWASDRGFIRFLAVTDMNDLPMFRASTKV